MSKEQTSGDSKIDTSIDVRRSDCDIDGFAARIAELVTAEDPVMVELGQADDDINRITLTVHQRAEESR